MTHDTLLNDLWNTTLVRLGGAEQLAASARSTRAFMRPREVKSAPDLLRLILGTSSRRARASIDGGEPFDLIAALVGATAADGLDTTVFIAAKKAPAFKVHLIAFRKPQHAAETSKLKALSTPRNARAA